MSSKPLPSFGAHTCSREGALKHDRRRHFAAGDCSGARFWLPVPGSPSYSWCTKLSQAFPNGRCYLYFPDQEALAERKLGLAAPHASSRLGGQRTSWWWWHKRGPGLLLPNLSFISQTLLPLGGFWRGACSEVSSSPNSRIWAAGACVTFPPASGHRRSPCLPLTRLHGCQGNP